MTLNKKCMYVKLIREQIAADKVDLKICDKIVKPEMILNESEIPSFSFQRVSHLKARSFASK